MDKIANSICISSSFALFIGVYYLYKIDSIAYNILLWIFPLILFLYPMITEYGKVIKNSKRNK